MEMEIEIKKKKIYTYVIVAIIVTVGYFLYATYQKKQDADFAQEVQVSDFEDAIPSQCENGEWTEFPDYSESGNFPEYKENTRLKNTVDDEYSNQDGTISFATSSDYALFFFTDRDVRIEGINIGERDKSNIYVKRIKCIGKEANKEVQAQRQNLMTYIGENINKLAIEKSQGDDWQVETFYFANDADVYVEYESTGSFTEEAPYDAKLWLIRASRMDASVPAIETLAYIQEDENDPDKNVVKVGSDLYVDADNMMVYEFDVDSEKWILQ